MKRGAGGGQRGEPSHQIASPDLSGGVWGGMLAGSVLDPLCVLGRLSEAMREFSNHSQL